MNAHPTLIKPTLIKPTPIHPTQAEIRAAIRYHAARGHWIVVAHLRAVGQECWK